MNIPVRVTRLEIEAETNYDDPTFPKHDMTKVHLLSAPDGVATRVQATIVIPTGAPVPFQLGDRLILTIERETAQPSVVEGLDGGVCMNCGRLWREEAGGACGAADLHLTQTRDEPETTPRDEVVGLGAGVR